MAPRTRKNRPKIHQRRLPDYLRDLLIQGEIIGPGLRNGDQIPGSRLLAQKYAVSQITLMRVFQELVEAGILEGGERRRLTLKDVSRCRNLTQARGFVTVLVPEIDYFSDFTRGLADAFRTLAPDRKLRLRVQSYQWDDESMLEQVGALLESRRSVGLVLKIAEAPGWHETLANLLRAGVPTVLFDSRHEDCDSVVIDETPGIHQALDQLEKSGCDPIVYLGRFTGRESIERNREKSVRAWFSQKKRPQNPQYFIEFLGNQSYDEWLPKLLSLVTKSPRVGVFCYNDKDALWVYRALKISGVSVPGQVSLIGYDDKYRFTGYDPIPFDIGLSSVDARHGEAGAEAGRLLLARMDQPGAPFEHKVLASRLIPRATGGA